MSAHGTRATGRHPDAWRARERYEFGHVMFELSDHPKNGVTFALRPALVADNPKPPPPLFSGHVQVGMAGQLRALADRMDELEEKIGGA